MNITPPAMTVINYHICTSCKANLPTPGRWAWVLGNGSRGELCVECAALDPLERAARAVARRKKTTAVPAIREQMTYEEYLKSPHWRYFRKQAIAHYGRQCCLCEAEGNGVKWNVHHRHYNSLGRETLADVRVLCEDCHHLYEDAKRWAGL